MEINHHSAATIGFHIDGNDMLHIIAEEKDPEYMHPHFEDGLNGIGGNWNKGKNTENTPKEVLEREIKKDFWGEYKEPSSINDILGQDFINRNPVESTYSEKLKEQIRPVGDIFMANTKISSDFMVAVNPPIMKTAIVYAATLYMCELNKSDYDEISTAIGLLNGKLTADNLKWNSRIKNRKWSTITDYDLKFAWGYGHMLNHFFKETLKMNIDPVNDSDYVKIDLIDSPLEKTFKEYEKKGINYKIKT